MFQILEIAGRFWVYSAPPVQVPLPDGKMYRIFDTIEEAVEFRKTL